MATLGHLEINKNTPLGSPLFGAPTKKKGPPRQQKTQTLVPVWSLNCALRDPSHSNRLGPPVLILRAGP